MQIGDLSRPHASTAIHDCAAFQAMRFLVVIGLMAAGSLALWTVQDEASLQDVIAADMQGSVSKPQRMSYAERPAWQPVVDSAPSAPATSSAAYVPAGGPAEPPSKADRAPAAPEPTRRVSVADAAPDAEQTGLAQPLSLNIPDDINVTGTVSQEASLPDAQPQSSSHAAGLVDLNTASLEQLNALKGAAGLGRAIIRGRPYASAEDLAKKRVLRRMVYERIKDQVTAR